MIHAYDKIYLSRAQGSLAQMLDFSVHDLNYSLTSFYEKFLESSVSNLFEIGDSTTLAGRSGVELALDVIDDELKADLYRPVFNRSPEYWTGWALAYFQWWSGLSFLKINSYIPINEIYEMYYPYHEMDITQFCEKMLELYNSRKKATNLKLFRLNAGISQKELAVFANVPLRTIQQYEQRQKNINAASAETIIKLAKVLFCSVEDLMEVSIE